MFFFFFLSSPLLNTRISGRMQSQNMFLLLPSVSIQYLHRWQRADTQRSGSLLTSDLQYELWVSDSDQLLAVEAPHSCLTEYEAGCYTDSSWSFFCFSSFCIFLSNPRKNSSCFVCLQRWKNLWDVLILTESSGRFKEKHPRLLLSLLHNWTSGTCSRGDDWISGGGNTGRKSFHVINTKIGPTFAFSRLFSSLFLDKTKQKKLTRFLFIYFHTVFQQKQHNLLHPLFFKITFQSFLKQTNSFLLKQK